MSTPKYRTLNIEFVDGYPRYRGSSVADTLRTARSIAREFRAKGTGTDVIIERYMSDPSGDIIPIEHWRFVPTVDGLSGYWKKLDCNGTPLN